MIIAAFASLIALTYLLAHLLRRAEDGIKSSEAVWDRIRKNLNTIADDDKYPFSVVAPLTLLALVTGCGCFTRGMLIHLFRQKMRIPQYESSHVQMLNAFDDAVDSLLPEQTKVIGQIVHDLAVYDTYRSLILGPLVRYLMSQAESEQAIEPVVSAQSISSDHIQKFVHATQPIAEREARHRTLPNKLTVALAR